MTSQRESHAATASADVETAPVSTARVAPMPSPVTGRVAPSAAVIARPLLVLLPLVALLVPAVLIGLLREPTYTAQARMLVGSFDSDVQATPGVVEANRSLAETYSRLVETDAIISKVADAVGRPSEELKGAISASSIPDSSIIRIEGSGSSSAEALQLAGTAAVALEEYARSGGQSAEEILTEYEQALIDLRAAEAEVARLQAAGTGTDATSRALAQVEAEAASAQLRADSLSQRYARVSQRGSTGNVQLIGEAADSGSDRRSVFQLAVAGALLLGIIAGIALATVVVNRQARALHRRTVGRRAEARTSS